MVDMRKIEVNGLHRVLPLLQHVLLAKVEVSVLDSKVMDDIQLQKQDKPVTKKVSSTFQIVASQSQKSSGTDKDGLPHQKQPVPIHRTTHVPYEGG